MAPVRSSRQGYGPTNVGAGVGAAATAAVDKVVDTQHKFAKRGEEAQAAEDLSNLRETQGELLENQLDVLENTMSQNLADREALIKKAIEGAEGTYKEELQANATELAELEKLGNERTTEQDARYREILNSIGSIKDIKVNLDTSITSIEEMIATNGGLDAGMDPELREQALLINSGDFKTVRGEDGRIHLQVGGKDVGPADTYLKNLQSKLVGKINWKSNIAGARANFTATKSTSVVNGRNIQSKTYDQNEVTKFAYDNLSTREQMNSYAASAGINEVTIDGETYSINDPRLTSDQLREQLVPSLVKELNAADQTDLGAYKDPKAVSKQDQIKYNALIDEAETLVNSNGDLTQLLPLDTKINAQRVQGGYIVPMLDKDGFPVIDPSTGLPRERRMTDEAFYELVLNERGVPLHYQNTYRTKIAGDQARSEIEIEKQYDLEENQNSPAVQTGAINPAQNPVLQRLVSNGTISNEKYQAILRLWEDNNFSDATVKAEEATNTAKKNAAGVYGGTPQAGNTGGGNTGGGNTGGGTPSGPTNIVSPATIDITNPSGQGNVRSNSPIARQRQALEKDFKRQTGMKWASFEKFDAATPAVLSQVEGIVTQIDEVKARGLYNRTTNPNGYTQSDIGALEQEVVKLIEGDNYRNLSSKVSYDDYAKYLNVKNNFNITN